MSGEQSADLDCRPKRERSVTSLATTKIAERRARHGRVRGDVAARWRRLAPRDTRECHCHPPRAHGSSLRLRARSMRRPARPRDRARGCPPPAAGVARILTRLARARGRQVRHGGGAQVGDGHGRGGRARRRGRGAARARRCRAPGETRGTRDANRTRGAPTRPSDVRKRDARARRARGGNRRPGGSARGASLAVRSRNETPPKHAARAAERARARTGGGGDRARRRRRGALAGGRGGARRRGARSGALHGRGCRGGARG